MSDMTNTTNSEATETKATATAKKSTKKSGKPVVAKKTKATKPVAKKSTKKSGKPVVAKKTKATKPVAKKVAKAAGEAKAPRGIGAYAQELLVTEPDVNKVLAAVQKKFPGAKTQVASIYWYRSQMNRAE